jgi:hypothetical protein
METGLYSTKSKLISTRPAHRHMISLLKNTVFYLIGYLLLMTPT